MSINPSSQETQAPQQSTEHTEQLSAPCLLPDTKYLSEEPDSQQLEEDGYKAYCFCVYVCVWFGVEFNIRQHQTYKMILWFVILSDVISMLKDFK